MKKKQLAKLTLNVEFLCRDVGFFGLGFEDDFSVGVLHDELLRQHCNSVFI
jgi:hypothetical protein